MCGAGLIIAPTPASPDQVKQHFIEQAGWCAPSPFTQSLMQAFGANYAEGGMVADLLAGWPDTVRNDLVGLRLAGALHYGVLSGMDEALSAVYPAREPRLPMAAIWPKAEAFLRRETAFVRGFIQHAPQTNEVNRSLILVPGFLKLAAYYQMPMHLLELGASAGLNQNWDRYTCEAGTWRRSGHGSGLADEAKVILESDWQAALPASLETQPDIATRAGCDLNPIDVSRAEEALRVQAYVWPDQTARLARLQGAIKLAEVHPVSVDRADAADWLEAKLTTRPKHGLSVIYHSVFLHYPPETVQDCILSAIEAAGARATSQAPLAWLSFESARFFGGDPDLGEMVAHLKTWPGGDAHIYAKSDGHIRLVTDP